MKFNLSLLEVLNWLNWFPGYHLHVIGSKKEIKPTPGLVERAEFVAGALFINNRHVTLTKLLPQTVREEHQNRFIPKAIVLGQKRCQRAIDIDWEMNNSKSSYEIFLF